MANVSPEQYEPGVLRVLQSKDEVRSYYNKIAKVYDFLAEKSEQPMRELALAKLAPQPGETILEIGYGTGHITLEIARAVGASGKVYGLDVSDEMQRLATELLANEGLADRAELSRGDAAHMAYADATFDGVYMSFTLELFDTPELPVVLAECLRVLKPGGRLAVAGMSREGERNFVVKAYEWTHRHFPNLMDCRPIYVRRALEAAGFEIRAADVETMWAPVEIVLGVKSGS